MAFVFAIVLLPLSVISGMQSRALTEAAQVRSLAALLGETLLATAPDVRLIQKTQETAAALALAIPALLDNAAECRAALQRVLDQAGAGYLSASYTPVAGDLDCTASGQAMEMAQIDLSPMVAKPLQAEVVTIGYDTRSGQPVLAFRHPVSGSDGIATGYVSILVAQIGLGQPGAVDAAQQASKPQGPVTLMTVDANGSVLAATAGLDDAAHQMPRDWRLAKAASNLPHAFVATSNDGKERMFAAFPLVESKVFAVGTWSSVEAGSPANVWGSAFFMPGLVWLVSLVVAVVASERMVSRHTRALCQSISSFADGNHRSEGLEFRGAVREFRDVADVYAKMTYAILHDEAELENMVHQREVLLREVHHRVKNNLQLISSIINMQMRQSHSHDARTLMKGLQDRVMSLATIHRGLYQTSGLADVRADELLSDIVRQILRMSTGPGRVFDVSTHFDDLRLIPDQAVPVSLLLTEALTNALKYAGCAPPGRPHIGISLRRDGEADAILVVSNSVTPEPGAASSEGGTGLGMQLLTAFGQQLGAVSTTTRQDGTYQLSVRFTVRSLLEGEATPEASAGLSDESSGSAPVAS